MNRLFVFEMDREHKCISTPLNLGVMQVNVFLEHMKKHGHNFDQCVEITEDILNGLKTIKFDHYDESWNVTAEESLKQFSLGNFLVSKTMSPFEPLSWELIYQICDDFKKIHGVING